MADSDTIVNDNDDATAYQLLGWPSKEDTVQSDAVVAEENLCLATSFHSKIRNTAGGVTAFRRAQQILSGEEGLLVFRQENEQREAACRRKDPLLIVRGYLRLIKCSLEPAASTAAAGPSNLSEDEWLRISCQLLKNLGDSLKAAIQNERKCQTAPCTPSSNLEEAFSPPSQSAKAVTYYFRSIAQTVHPHIAKRIKLLGPVFRSFGDVADSFLSLLDADKARMEKFVSAFVPSVGWEALSGLQSDMEKLSRTYEEFIGLLEKAAFRLMEFADDWLEKFRLSISEQDCSFIAPEKQAKVVVFLFARITSLVLMVARIQNASKGEAVASHMFSFHGKEGGRKLITGFLQRLIKACNLSLVAKARLENDTDDSSRVGLLAVAGLRTKAEHYLSKILGDFKPNNANIIGLGLECFIELPSLDEGKVMQSDSLGKLLLKKYVMKKLFEAKTMFFPESATMVNFYKTLLHDVPKCYHLFHTSFSGYNLQSQAREILSDLVYALENSSHMLCRSEKAGRPNLCKNMVEDQCWQRRITQQHRLLLRWLAPASMNCNPLTSVSTNHPITNEMLMLIIQKRVALSCAIDDQYSQKDASHFVSLLSQLLFHNHTATSHRRNIAKILIRFLSPADSNINSPTKQNGAKQLTIELLWVSTTRELINSTPRKRKRSRGPRARSSLLPDDVYTICKVLEVLAKESISSGKSFDDEISAEIMKLWNGILNRSINTGNTNKVIFLLSLSAGALRGTSNPANFFLPFDGGVKKILPNAFIEGVLAFIELQLGTKKNSASSSPRKILMHLACVQLLDALSSVVAPLNGARTKCKLSESQIIRIGKNLKQFILVASAIASVQAIGLQYDVVSAASKMAGTIQSEFSEASWKPLVESINHTVAKPSWYYVAPTVSNVVDFVRTLPSHVRGQVSKAMPALKDGAEGRKLMRSRLQGELFCIVAKQTIDPLNDMSYSAVQEFRFLLAWCTDIEKESLYFFGDKSIMMKSGSKAFLHHDEDGKIMAIVIVPVDGKMKSSSEVLSSISTSKYDSHSIRWNCEMKIDQCPTA